MYRCVSLPDKIPLKYIKVHAINVGKCKKNQNPFAYHCMLRIVVIKLLFLLYLL